MTVITGFRTRDLRYRLAPGEGTDAVHSTGLYGYAVCILDTDDENSGHGFGFTLGAGTDLVERAIQHVAKPLVGREVEELMANFGEALRNLAEHPALRWLGPHNGVLHLALAAVANACWDLWAKKRDLPLWQLLLSLSPVQLLATLDLSYLEDELTRDEALELLEAAASTRCVREAAVLASGVPGYDTSAGWLGFSDAEIESKVQASLASGFRAVKLKVGGMRPGDMERDLRRMALIRHLCGDDFHIAVDANQQWSVPQALEICARLAPLRPYFVEEPTHPADVLGHAAIAKAIAPVPVACGEAIPNRVVFKNFIAAGGVQVCQCDPTRLAGPSECLAVAMMAKKRGLRVVPHVGDMGQISQHLVIAYHVLLDLPLPLLECIPHLREYFVHPAVVERGRYVVPLAPGASTDLKRDVAAVESGTECVEGDVWLGD